VVGMTVKKGSEFEPTLGNCNYVVAHSKKRSLQM
jgi:hypothetical protein